MNMNKANICILSEKKYTKRLTNNPNLPEGAFEAYPRPKNTPLFICVFLVAPGAILGFACRFSEL